MLVGTVKIGFHARKLPRPIVEIERSWWEPRECNPTQAERDTCPDTFRCFVCDERYPAVKLGGTHHGRWICRLCYPWTDEWFVGRLIHIDQFGRKPVPHVNPEDWRPPPPCPIMNEDDPRAEWLHGVIALWNQRRLNSPPAGANVMEALAREQRIKEALARQ